MHVITGDLATPSEAMYRLRLQHAVLLQSPPTDALLINELSTRAHF
jgi:hypothetical protein